MFRAGSDSGSSFSKPSFTKTVIRSMTTGRLTVIRLQIRLNSLVIRFKTVRAAVSFRVK